MAQTNGITVITVYHGGGDAPASLGNAYNLEEGNPRQQAEALSRLFAAGAAGIRPMKVRARTDSCVGVQAALTLAVTQANIAAGEYLTIVIPGVGGFKLTAVASGPDVTEGEFVSETSNAVTATNIAAAVDGMLGLKDYVDASTNNGFVAIDGTTNGLTPAGGSFSGGKDASTRPTATITCVSANTDANDTIQIGKTVFTAKAGDASGDSQFNIGASNTAMGDNLVAKINAHPDLLGLVTGVASSGVITLTFDCDPRVAVHMVMQTSDADGLVLTAQPTTTLTLTNTVATRAYALGAP
jgi:hypothetical protein